MDERRYWAFRAYSTPDAVKQRIAHFVEGNNLRERIPRMYCEKGTAQHGAREFYFFLDIEGEDDDILYDVLHRPDLQTIGSPLDQPFTYGEIKSMTGREVDLESIGYARRIGYRPPEVIRPDNPFDIATASEPDETAREAYNQLLYWISAIGQGTWQAFREACRILQLSTSSEARHIFRRLRLLGHVEYLNNGSHWTICPSCLVKIADHGVSHFFLAGAQVPALVREILDCDGVEIETKTNRGGPESVFLTLNLQADAQGIVNTLRQTCTYFRDAGTASAKLADVLPELNGWYHEVLRPIGVAAERYWLEKWNGEKFTASPAPPPSAGMYRLKNLDDRSQEPDHYYYFDPEPNQWFQSDWYGLRFLANYNLGIHAELTYEPRLEQLFAPSAHHLPDLYERALVLASGKLPSAVSDGLVYENINKALAETICTKLCAELKGI
jgi:hypothetical protein